MNKQHLFIEEGTRNYNDALSNKKISTILIIHQLDLPNFLSITGLIFSFLCVIFVSHQRFYESIICMICAGISDVFDGFVAKRVQRTELQSSVGKQLDSLVDICSFGFSPAIFGYLFGLQDSLSIFILILYISACGLRLAFFNSVGLLQEGEKKYFVGLPVTYAALFIPITLLAYFFVSKSIMMGLLTLVYLCLTFLMLSNLKIVKLQGIWYSIVLFGALNLMAIYTVAIFWDKQWL